MMIRNRSKRKPSGGLLSTPRKKRLADRARQPLPTRIGERRIKPVRVRGGGIKRNLLAAKTVNLVDRETGDVQTVEIKDVVKNPADPQYVRRNIITKGAVIETDAGKARITSRPGQDGVVNAVLIEE